MKTLFIKYCQHASPVINYGTLSVIGVTCLLLNKDWNGIDWLIWFPLGMTTWSFMEYFLHRFVFHFRSASRIIEQFTYYIHGIHHAYFKTTNYVPFAQNIVFYGGGLAIAYLLMGIYAFIFYMG